MTGSDLRVPDPRLLVVRSAEAGDVHDVAVFQTETWREAYRGLVPDYYLDAVGVTEREHSWGARIASSSREVVVARYDERIVGVVSWSRGDPTHDGDDLDAVELKTLYVDAGLRGSGLGATLLTRVLAAAGNEGGAVYLWVFERNTRAVAFYGSHGFEFDGARKLDPGTSVVEIRMTRPAR
ncbi:GNAT family N-acetyltransferase [Frigoribacterium sp. 2-23]|uniref:GNAT family N-acetyltransferase n=1 Tax=Frigoribacterium sp. 2-23 TaxID=3415006 RepID=UPI003C6FE9AB